VSETRIGRNTILWKCKGYDLPRDLPLIISALLWLLYYELLIHLKPLPVILAKIREIPPEASLLLSEEETGIILDKLWRACGFWMSRVLNNTRPCLRRSLVLYRWCRKLGLESKVVIGVDKNGDVLKGHAWLIVKGRIYREDPVALAKDYTILLEG